MARRKRSVFDEMTKRNAKFEKTFFGLVWSSIVAFWTMLLYLTLLLCEWIMKIGVLMVKCFFTFAKRLFSGKSKVSGANVPDIQTEYRQYKPNPEWTMNEERIQSKQQAAMIAPQVIKQFEESKKLVNTTATPSVFFQRYDFLIGRLEQMVDCSYYVRLSGDDPRDILNSVTDAENRKSAEIGFLKRFIAKAQGKIDYLKTQKGKLNAAKRMRTELTPYFDYMSDEAKCFFDEQEAEVFERIVKDA